MSEAATAAGVRPVAIVTGGLRGIGLACARQLAREGFDLALFDLIEPDATSAAVCAMLQAEGAQVAYYRLDISDLTQQAPVLAQVVAAQGLPVCLVNNAGIAARPLTDVLDLAPEAFDRSLDVNLRGTFFLTQAFARLRLAAQPAEVAAQPAPSIIMITSIAAELVSTDRAQYCVSKAGLSMVTRLFAARLAPHGIAVHEVRPGFIRTEMTASAGSTVIDEWLAQGRVPMPRWGEAEDVAALVGTLARGRLPYVTGQPFWVAGGLNIARAT